MAYKRYYQSPTKQNSCNKKKDWTNFKYWRNNNKTLIRASKKNLLARAFSDKKNNKYLRGHLNNIKGNQRLLQYQMN